MASKEASLEKFDPSNVLPSNWESILESRLERIQKNQLEPERTRSSNSLIVARWDETQQLAVVEKVKGTHLDTAGNPGRFFTLYPEEMVFLVDKGRLIMYLDITNRPASLEECYQVMLDAKIGLEEYIVYAHLKSLGSIVFRHRNIQYETENLPGIDSSILYDVWLPKTGHKWTRKNPGLPSFFILLITSHDPLQCTSVLSNVANAIKVSEIPIKLATVAGGVVDFFDCQEPVNPRNGASPSKTEDKS